MGKESQAIVGFGERFKSHGGVEINVFYSSNIEYKKPGEVSEHEASHGVINPSNVKLITREPGPGSRGRVEPYRMDTVMAAASIADGHNGTGHDAMIVRYFGSPSDISTAKSTLLSKAEHKHALASAVEAHGTLYNRQVMTVMDHVNHGKPIMVIEKQPDGTVNQREEKIPWYATSADIKYAEPDEMWDVADIPKAA